MRQRITVLTGAGISAESGLSTFRASDGLWCSHRVEDVATPEAFRKQPLMVQEFYNERRRALLSPAVKPNKAHEALSRLQHEVGEDYFSLITQNIDDLHERAGSTNVHHMHGELLKVRCMSSGKVFSWTRDIDARRHRCPCCHTMGTLRPHVVWFNEIPLEMDAIESILTTTDLFVAVGTSGNVYPAAGFVATCRAHGAKTLELNLEAGSNQSVFDESVYGKASTIVPRWVQSVLGSAA